MSEHYEALLAFISTHVPTPYSQDESDGEVVFVGGDPHEIVVRLTESAVIVEEYAVRWDTPFRPIVSPRRVGMVRWRRLPESRLMSVVGDLIRGASEMRRSRFRRCDTCGRTHAPEWMAEAHLCRSCAEGGRTAVH